MSIVLPEHRQIDMYSKKKNLPIAEDFERESADAEKVVKELAEVFSRFDAALGAGADPDDPASTWKAYQDLPRSSGLDRLTGEAYRTLRVFMVATRHPTGRVTVRNGIVKVSSTVDYTSVAIRITRAGISLLGSLVAYRLAAETQFYPEAYVEAMLCRYWTDIVAEIRWFYDEDHALFQFRDQFRMNRHFRFDCDNPRVTIADETFRFEVGDIYSDPARFPIDFFIVVAGRLHIVPVEALSSQSIAVDRLYAWRARLPDGLTLPSAFRRRFTRETQGVGQPTT